MTEPPKVRGASKEYNEQIRSLAYTILGLCRAMPPLQLTEEQIKLGTDSLEGVWKENVQGLFEFWLHYRNYELSYNQMNLAFWWAVRECEKLEIVQRS